MLRKDGTCWLNLGDSFSSGVANVPDLLTRKLKGDVFFFGCADPRRRSAERIHILLYDKLAPNPVFKPFLRAQRIIIKQGQNDFCQVGGALDTPIECWIGGSFSVALPQNSSTENLVDLPQNVGIVITAGDLCANPTFRDAIALAIQDRQTPLAIKVTSEPITESIAAAIPVWDAITFNAGSISIPNINLVNKSVPFFDGVELRARDDCDFTIRSATTEHVTFRLKRGCDLRFQSVSQLFLLRDGLTPYRIEYRKAIKYWNANRQKQELGIPEMLKRALMEDGWICRQTIIWSKPNPMPESCTDRCTKAHEYIFLLTKAERYYFDAAAIAETSITTDPRRPYTSEGAKQLDGRDEWKSGQPRDGTDFTTRNKRSVWRVATAPYSEAHFATFPPALIEPCILAGCPAKCCAKCGAPWVMEMERSSDNSERAPRGKALSSPRKDGLAWNENNGRGFMPVKRELLCFLPSCSCDAGTISGTVLDPFGGAGTTGLVADRLQRNAILIELNAEYAAMAERRCFDDAPLFAEAAE